MFSSRLFYKSKILPCQVLYRKVGGRIEDLLLRFSERSSTSCLWVVVTLKTLKSVNSWGRCCCIKPGARGLFSSRNTQVVELQCQVLYQGCVNPDVVRELFSRRRCASLCQVVVQWPGGRGVRGNRDLEGCSPAGHKGWSDRATCAVYVRVGTCHILTGSGTLTPSGSRSPHPSTTFTFTPQAHQSIDRLLSTLTPLPPLIQDKLSSFIFRVLYSDKTHVVKWSHTIKKLKCVFNIILATGMKSMVRLGKVSDGSWRNP